MFIKYLNETICEITSKSSMKSLFKSLLVQLKKNNFLKNILNSKKITIIVEQLFAIV